MELDINSESEPTLIDNDGKDQSIQSPFNSRNLRALRGIKTQVDENDDKDEDN